MSSVRSSHHHCYLFLRRGVISFSSYSTMLSEFNIYFLRFSLFRSRRTAPPLLFGLLFSSLGVPFCYVSWVRPLSGARRSFGFFFFFLFAPPVLVAELFLFVFYFRIYSLVLLFLLRWLWRGCLYLVGGVVGFGVVCVVLFV